MQFGYSNHFYRSAPTSEMYTLSLHDALPISGLEEALDEDYLKYRLRSTAYLAEKAEQAGVPVVQPPARPFRRDRDRKSTRLNSSHVAISYAVFCLKKKMREKRK